MMNHLHYLSLVGPVIYLTTAIGVGVYFIILALANRSKRKGIARRLREKPVKSDSDAQLREVSTHR